MKLALNLYPVTLQLKETFTISRDSYNQRRSLIVALSADGETGYGETSEHSYYGITIEKLIDRAESLRPVIEHYDFHSPELLWQFLQSHLHDLPFLQCAINNAAYDLYGKLQGIPCHHMWMPDVRGLIKTCYTISIASTDEMVEKIKKLNFEIYKIKLGTNHDLEIMQQLRQHTDAVFRVDANCGWTAEQTIEYAPVLKELGVEFIEQPLPAEDTIGMKKVRLQSVLPILADESCIREEDVEECAPYFHGIVIKLMKCGGITPALRMINKARSLNLKIMCGCMVESSVGISAIAQLLPLLDYVDMDGALLIDNDPASGVVIQPDGTVTLPTTNGLGIRLNHSSPQKS